MEIRELYNQIDGDYEGLVKRLGGEKLVPTLLKLFVEDENYRMLESSMANEDYENAFRGVHGLKGLCANLSITRLLNLSSDLTECLRNQADIEQAKVVFPVLSQEYEKVVGEIKKCL